MNGIFNSRTIVLCMLTAGIFLFAGCVPNVMAPRIPVMKYGEKAPFGPETGAAPIREVPEEIKPSEIVK